MRTIKFRAWDRKKKQFDTCRNGGNIINFSLDYKGIHALSRRSFKIYSQFTGLLDKNGKEIYEGDIVKFRNIDNSTPTEILPVLWDDKACGFVCRDNQHSKGVDMASCYDTISGEIIGNIWESPELLTNK